MKIEEFTLTECMVRYRDILDSNRIPDHHREPLVRFVVLNELDEDESGFLSELDRKSNYQQAVDQALDRKFASLRTLYNRAFGDRPT